MSLPPEWLSVLDAIARSFREASMRGELLAWPGVPWVIHHAETLDAMIDAGWLVAWDLTPAELGQLRPWVPQDGDGTQALTLTPWAAERLRVEIVEEGESGRTRWGKGWMDEDEDGLAERGIPFYSPLPSWPDLPEQPKHIEAGIFVPFRPKDMEDKSPGPVEVAIRREEIAMRTEEVEVYDAEKDERRVEVVSMPLSFPNMCVHEVKTDAKIKGKKGGGKAKAKAKGRKAS